MKLFNLTFTTFDIIFDALLLIITVGIIWFLPYDIPVILNLEALAILFSVLTILYLAHRELQFESIVGWLGFLLLCVVIVVFAIGITPIWWEWAILVLKGQSLEAGRLLNSRPHANIILFIGLNGVYVSITGIIRHLLFKFIKQYQDRYGR